MSPREDKFTIEVLDDGTLKIDTDGISPANHKQADELLKTLVTMLGGNMVQVKKKTRHQHTHLHKHEHQ